MTSRISSTISLVAGLAFAIVLTFLFSLLIGCDSSEKETATDATAVRTETPRPVAAAVPAPRPPAPAPVEPAVQEPVVVSYEDAEAAYRERNYGESYALFEQYVDQHPDNPWGHYMLGLSAWKTERYDEAESAFLSALDKDAAHVKSRLNLARVYLDTDRAEEALAQVDEAMALDPSFGATFRLKGRALHELGRLADAEDAYREAIRIDKRDAWAMNNLGVVLMDEAFYDLAVAPLARATEIMSEQALFFNNLGMALEHTNHFREAETAYARAVEIDAGYANAVANLDRVGAVEEDPQLGEVDLNALARDFESEITSWSDEDVPREAPPVALNEDAVLEESVGESAVESRAPEDKSTEAAVQEESVVKSDSTVATGNEK